MADPFQFELVSPERLLMSEPVEQVVVPGSEGYFTVLKGHAPFMSTMRPGVVEILRGNTNFGVFVRGGFADVSAGLTIWRERAVRSTRSTRRCSSRSEERRKTWSMPDGHPRRGRAAQPTQGSAGSRLER